MRPSSVGVPDPEYDAYLSSVSAWEIAVKHRVGRLPLPEPASRLIPRLPETHGIERPPLDEEAALQRLDQSGRQMDERERGEAGDRE